MKKRDLYRAEARHDLMKSHKIREEVHDTYQTRKKFREPSVCRQCDTVCHEGRWQWMEESPQGAFDDLCPACHRIKDKYPAGEITLSGTFLAAHREEILGLVRNEAEAETSQHPLHRIMGIEERPDEVVVTTTDRGRGPPHHRREGQGCPAARRHLRARAGAPSCGPTHPQHGKAWQSI
jgi:hypothetical protein